MTWRFGLLCSKDCVLVSDPSRSQIFEQSSFANEIGAAINICPNASRVVLPWGLDPAQARLNVAESVRYSMSSE